MPFCSTCGLSISETAQFCPTCGTRALGESVPGTVARPLWAAADAAPLTDGFAPPDPIASTTATRSALHSNSTRIAITAVAAVLVVVLVAVFAHNLVTGSQGERYTEDMARQIHPGLSLTQVEAIMGAPPTSHVYPTDGSDSCFWTNPDGSEVWANFTNDTVDVGASYTASQGATSSRFAIGSAGLLAVLAVFAVFTAVVFGACLFVATKLFGYSIGVNQVILFAVVTGAVRLVPYVGWLLALLVGVALIERWSSAGWWTALLIILVAGFVAGVLTATVVGAGFGLSLAL